MKRPLSIDGGELYDGDGVYLGDLVRGPDAGRLVAAFNTYPDLFGMLDELIKRAEAVDKGLTDYDLVILAGERALLRKAIEEGRKLIL